MYPFLYFTQTTKNKLQLLLHDVFDLPTCKVKQIHFVKSLHSGRDADWSEMAKLVKLINRCTMHSITSCCCLNSLRLHEMTKLLTLQIILPLVRRIYPSGLSNDKSVKSFEQDCLLGLNSFYQHIPHELTMAEPKQSKLFVCLCSDRKEKQFDNT